MFSKRSQFIIGAILLAALSRLLPHPPNFSPIGALALFGGAMLPSRWLGLLLPLSAMLISDLVLGFHNMIASVYLSFGLTVAIGFVMGSDIKLGKVVLASLSASVLFFLITNFHMWMVADSFYARNWQGLMACYTAAIPFFRNSVISDLFYSAILFGSFYFAESKLPALQRVVAK